MEIPSNRSRPSIITAAMLLVSSAFFFALTLVALAAIYGVIVMFLWNWLVPTLFGLKTITFVQAWGLTGLTGFLFRSSSSTPAAKKSS